MTGTDDGAARSTGRIRRAARLAVAISAATGAISAAACHDPSGAPRGLERAPLEEWTVLQPFGAWNASRGGYHLATDLVAVPGTPVRTAGAGQVIFAQVEVEGYGAVVVVRHAGADPEVTTLYGHLSARRGLQVRAGESVAAGQVVGFVADDDEDGGPWEPHLHFGVRRGSPSVDDSSLCGLWPYVGYTRACGGWTHEQVRALWADPATMVPVPCARRGPRFCVPEPAATFRGQR